MFWKHNCLYAPSWVFMVKRNQQCTTLFFFIETLITGLQYFIAKILLTTQPLWHNKNQVVNISGYFLSIQSQQIKTYLPREHEPLHWVWIGVFLTMIFFPRINEQGYLLLSNPSFRSAHKALHRLLYVVSQPPPPPVSLCYLVYVSISRLKVTATSATGKNLACSSIMFPNLSFYVVKV